MRSWTVRQSGVVIVLTGVLACARSALADIQPAVSSTTNVTLEQCFQSALHINETVGISRESIRLFDAQYRDKLGLVLPHVDWIKTQFYQQDVNNGQGGFGGSALLAVQPNSYFQLVQPIFAGFRDWNVVHAAQSIKQQAHFDERQAEQQLLSDVAGAFYASLTENEQIETLQETRRLALDRVKDLQRWVNVGRSRFSDVLAAQTEVATLDAQIAAARRIEMESRELLRFLAGTPPESVLRDDRPQPAPVPLETALERAGGRPDLMAMEEQVRQAHLNVKYAKGSYLPTLGLVAHDYTERVGFLSDVRWDATFRLDMPLLEGGSNRAQIQEARSQDIMAELSLARLKRAVEQQVRTSQQDLGNIVVEEIAYRKAVDMGNRNYEAQKEEYRLGRASNIEVLQVLTSLQDVKRQWVAAKYSAKLDDILARISMGEGL